MGPARFERATSCSGGKRSIQLSYGPGTRGCAGGEKSPERPIFATAPRRRWRVRVIACAAAAGALLGAPGRPLDALAQGDGGARVEAIADGVFVILHDDATPDWPHGNTTVIVGDSAVLVVDATYLPSRAAADIALIRARTRLPVRWLVNTHWHYDHIFGNSAYAAAYPGLAIVAHDATRRLMTVNARRFAAGVVADSSPARLRLAELRDSLRHSPPASRLESMRREIADREREQAELASYRFTPPTVGFDRSMTVDLGGRRVALSNFGRGNTPGDVVAYLPEQRILIAGDLLVAPVPYAYSSSPGEWIRVLGQLDALDAAVIVPGHGPVFRDERYLHRVAALLEGVVREVAALASRGRTLDQVRAEVGWDALRAEFAADSGDARAVWDDSIVRALAERAFQEARGIH